MLSIRETVSLKIAKNSRAASRRSSETDEKYAACQHRHETQCKSMPRVIVSIECSSKSSDFDILIYILDGTVICYQFVALKEQIIAFY